MFLRTIAVCALSLLSATAALAEIAVSQAYIRSASPMAKTGAAYMELHNLADTEDRLIGARTDVAVMAEVHTSTDLGNGVMQMGPVEGGLVIPAQGMVALRRGGDHVMLMGLSAPLVDGSSVTVTLQFETAGEVTIEIPVDQTRAPEADGGS